MTPGSTQNTIELRASIIEHCTHIGLRIHRLKEGSKHEDLYHLHLQCLDKFSEDCRHLVGCSIGCLYDIICIVYIVLCVVVVCLVCDH